MRRIEWALCVAGCATAQGQVDDVAVDDTAAGDTAGGDDSRAGEDEPALFTGGKRLEVRKITGADGSEQLLGFWDTRHDLSCTFQLDENGDIRCLPDDGVGRTASGMRYADAQCTQPLLVLQRTSSCGADDPRPRRPGALAMQVCGETHWFPVGAERTSGTVYAIAGATCGTYPLDYADVWVWDTTDDLTADQFVEGEETRE